MTRAKLSQNEKNANELSHVTEHRQKFVFVCHNTQLTKAPNFGPQKSVPN